MGRGAGHRAAGGGGPASPLIDDRVITVRVVREDLKLFSDGEAEVMVKPYCSPSAPNFISLFMFSISLSQKAPTLFISSAPTKHYAFYGNATAFPYTVRKSELCDFLFPEFARR